MNKLIALIYFVLSLYGCDAGGGTYITRVRADGADTLYSKATAQSGVARFECLRSASGQCYYTVFPHDCASTPGRAAGSSTGQRTDRCGSEPVERFAIASGDSRQIPGLQNFHLCVSTEDETPGPDCEMPKPLAAR